MCVTPTHPPTQGEGTEGGEEGREREKRVGTTAAERQNLRELDGKILRDGAVVEYEDCHSFVVPQRLHPKLHLVERAGPWAWHLLNEHPWVPVPLLVNCYRFRVADDVEERRELLVAGQHPEDERGRCDHPGTKMRAIPREEHLLLRSATIAQASGLLMISL